MAPADLAIRAADYQPRALHDIPLVTCHLLVFGRCASATAPYNGPIWNMQVNASISKGHSDLWNPRFTALLLQLLGHREAANTVLQRMPVPELSR